MIKINLANTLLNKNVEVKQPMNTATVRDIGIKVFLILLPLIAIIFYEKTDIDAKNERVTQLKNQLNSVVAQLQQAGSVDDIVQQVREQGKDLDEKLKLMKQIFSLRSQKIQAINLLQQHIPEQCWLKNVSFDERRVRITGNCTDISSAQTYVGRLTEEKNIFGSTQEQDIAEEGKSKQGDFTLYQFKLAMELRE
jgi:Tfp pilus assembly protein PilN